MDRREMLLIAGSVGIGALVAGGYIGSRFQGAVATAKRRVSKRSHMIKTRFGMLEYAEDGAGAPLLMVHGTGGGFDQGLSFATALQSRGHRIIAPSRFGYLRSDFPSRPSLVNQADAFLALLDHLRIDRLPVIGGSAGALSALAFALRHPDRCTSLILLVPAANLSGADPVEMGPIQQTIVRALLASDFLYWSVLQTMPEQLIGTLLATDPKLLPKVSPAERKRAFEIASDIMPIHARAKGLLNDAKQAGQPATFDFAQLKIPLLIISAEDDRFGTVATARKIAAMVPHAVLTILPEGGHIWLGHNEDVANQMHDFLSVATSNPAGVPPAA